MRDLVESVIGQVMKKTPTMKSSDKVGNSEAFQANRAIQPTEIKDQEMWGACCQFEAIFLQQMMVAMRKTVPESDLTPRSYATSTYESMMDQAISESGSKQAPLGLAMNMYRQLQRDGHGATAIQDIQKATDTLKKLDVVENPIQGGV